MYSDTQEVFIRRHCMQQLLHDAISCLSSEQDTCQGLLAGGGNMIKESLAVTKKTQLNQQACASSLADSADNHAMIGVYLSTNASCACNPERLNKLIELVQNRYGRPPDFYLRLELSHKGRVDARLFTDAAFKKNIALNMQEDGDSTVSRL